MLMAFVKMLISVRKKDASASLRLKSTGLVRTALALQMNEWFPGFVSNAACSILRAIELNKARRSVRLNGFIRALRSWSLFLNAVTARSTSGVALSSSPKRL